MGLDLYRSKRDFKTTPEPKGKAVKRKTEGLRFVIQKHAASRLHYDFRLELNGILLSWAVPKGPSLDPNEKRLAVHVEDHPIEYGDFEGVIPPRQYGSGAVLLWDQGTWVPKEDPVSGYRKGRLKFELHGKKLKGGWIMIRTRSSQYGGDKAWLLMKEDDEFARRGREAHIVDDAPASVVSGRSIQEIAADPDRVWHSNKSVAENVKSGAVRKKKPRFDLSKVEGARNAPLPAFVEPVLATLVKEPPAGEDWVHEMKYDGYRMLCRIEDGEAVMYSRNRKDWTGKFPAIARAAARLPVTSAWVDGELVVMDAEGRSSFQALQNALSGEDAGRLHYYVFDLPYLDGFDLRDVMLLERKRLLQLLLKQSPATVKLSAHIEGAGPEFFAQACNAGLEGIVSKRANSLYRAGRGRDWVKVKCAKRQEMVIGGFTDPEGSRKGFGALLLGVHEPGGKLRYSGKVGTGFSDESLESLRQRLDGIVRKEPPFSNPPKGAEARRAHWVKPQLVAEVSFTEWTEDGTLRHPSFQGLREDKKASEVVREIPVATPAGPEETKKDPARTAEVESRKSTSAPRSRKRTDAGDTAEAEDVVAGIKLTNPSKLLYPEAGITKRDLALYYERIGELILPHLRDRPLTLVRCPDGWPKHCFYQKHADKAVPDVIDRIEIQESDGTDIYMMANSVSAIVATVQMGALELHPWGSRANKLGFPDCMIFDFDPDESLPWSALVQAVELLRTLLDDIGLHSFLKTTGGKGLHVVLPIRPTAPWDTAKGFSKAIAEVLTGTFPDRFTSKMSKASRTGKIFVDYLRNGEGATAIAPYATRAKANAPVATPIAWSELAKDVRFDHFNVSNVPERLKRQKKDPWAGFFDLRQAVTKTMMKKVGYAQP
jgi:bifunctional non-homologous end joining protein LigD